MDKVNVVGVTPEVASRAMCLFCKKSPAEHVTPEGFKCESNPATTYPMRRETDEVMFMPVMMGMGEDVTTAAPPRKPRARSKRTVKRNTATRRGRQSRAKEQRELAPTGDAQHRGRTAGLYVATGREPKKLTESIRNIYMTLRRTRSGRSAADVAEHLKMPLGTVGWGLQKLAKQHAVKRVSVAANV